MACRKFPDRKTNDVTMMLVWIREVRERRLLLVAKGVAIFRKYGIKTLSSGVDLDRGLRHTQSLIRSSEATGDSLTWAHGSSR